MRSGPPMPAFLVSPREKQQPSTGCRPAGQLKRNRSGLAWPADEHGWSVGSRLGPLFGSEQVRHHNREFFQPLLGIIAQPPPPCLRGIRLMSSLRLLHSSADHRPFGPPVPLAPPVQHPLRRRLPSGQASVSKREARALRHCRPNALPLRAFPGQFGSRESRNPDPVGPAAILSEPH